MPANFVSFNRKTENAFCFRSGALGRMAATMMSAAAQNCGDDKECVRLHLKKEYPFDSNGVLKGEIVLKTVKNQRFVTYLEAS